MKRECKKLTTNHQVLSALPTFAYFCLLLLLAVKNSPQTIRSCSAYFCILRHTTAYFSILLHTSASMHTSAKSVKKTHHKPSGLVLHTSAYFCIFWQTSAYYCILLHTSSYFSILPLRVLKKLTTNHHVLLCILLHTSAYFGILLHTSHTSSYFCILLHTSAKSVKKTHHKPSGLVLHTSRHPPRPGTQFSGDNGKEEKSTITTTTKLTKTDQAPELTLCDSHLPLQQPYQHHCRLPAIV